MATEIDTGTVRFHSERFGEIEAQSSSVIDLEGGIVGLPDNGRFILLDAEEEGSSFRWLQSLDDPTIAFVVADPFDLFGNYEPEIPDADLEVLGVKSPDDIALICILTVPGNVRDVSANLLAPIVVNIETRRGKQIVLTSSAYKTKHRLFGDPSGQDATGQAQ